MTWAQLVSPEAAALLDWCAGANCCFSVCTICRREMAELRAELDEEKLKRVALQVTIDFLQRHLLGLSIVISPIRPSKY